ncbi:hypothetical protein [Dyella flagellata]|uniref:Uncharacterized protein n=1 Tax=Dyella flagellata TaxID=1867833 RepID=A0ABQ5X9T0_9GAMM|nr:hypothetical protein [Dyella flagellata]GLQ87818.1 hypothetical protein GCM10007898_13860 [Dyella flagellata]
MQRYRTFASVDVRHDYFADGDARQLLFQPHAETLAFLRRFEMLLYADGRSLTISVAESQLQGIWSERMDGDEPRMLCFDVRSADAACAYYTGTVSSPSGVEDDGALPAPLLPAPNTAAAPWAIIALPIVTNGDFAAWTSSLGSAYRLRMHSRSTIWKYLLTGDWRGRALSIVDQRGEIAFSAPAQERLPNGQSALAVHSTTPIALRERPPQRFQLRDVTEAPERVLISRLPGATPQRLWRETVRGEPTTVSEIFVHS